MTLKVLLTTHYMLPLQKEFEDAFVANDIEVIEGAITERLHEEDLLPIVGDIDGVICGDDAFTERVLDAAPKLKVISKWGTGTDSIDVKAAQKRGIAVCRTPNAFSEPVGDSTLGYILGFARRQPWMDRDMKQGIWDKIPGRALNESVIGVIGVGDTGSATLRRAGGFGGTLLGNDIRTIDPDITEALGVEMVERDDLLARSDFVCLHCDLNPTSFHLMSTETLKKMKETAILINMARGPVVDEPALIAALQGGDIAGAALDVFEHEPLPADSPLKDMDNVMLAPHNSNSSPGAWHAVHWNTVNQLLDALKAAS